MISEISNKKKLVYLLVISIIILFGLYKKNFSKIFQIKSELENIGSSSQNQTFYDNDVQMLRKEIKELETYIGDTESNSDFIQREITNFISHNGAKVSIVKINPIHSIVKDDFRVHSFMFVLEGDYFSLMELLYDIEDKLTISKIVNTEFEVQKNYSLGKEELYMRILFQNYEKI